ncbi:MAG: hypothetical protein WBO36_08095, partial [Saprospiraceae bacterium]
MKTIILALSIIMGWTLNTGSGSLYDYDKSWLQVEKYIEEGRPKSALTLVKEIQTQAENEKNNDQFIKAIVYWTRLTIQTDEKGIENAIENMENILKSSTAPVRQMVSSYLAELYQQYFNNYRYEISQRSEVSGEKGVDFRTWTTLQFITTIEAYYIASLSDKDALNIPTSQFNVSLIKHDSAAVVFRPTLYELLADQAFSFFNNYTQYSIENSSSFEVDEPWYFDPATDFVSRSISNKDESSPKYKILRLYQDLLDMQHKNGHQDALADYDLKRLSYVFGQSTLDDKNELYIQALENLGSTHNSQPYYTEIIAVLAGQVYRIEADTMAKVKALDMCETAIKKYPASTGAAKCQQIINDIKKPFLLVYSEQVYPSSLTMLFALDYNNLSKVTIE